MREIIVKAEEKLTENEKGQLTMSQTPVLATPVAVATAAVGAFVAGYTAAEG